MLKGYTMILALWKLPKSVGLILCHVCVRDGVRFGCGIYFAVGTPVRTWQWSWDVFLFT